MADKFSFDIVSEVNMMEVDNAVNQAQKELVNRFDFKGSKSAIELNKNDKKITLIADDDYKMKALKDILEGRFAKRGVSIKSLNYRAQENAFEGYIRQTAEIVSGLPLDKAKELAKLIRDSKIKVQTQIDGEKVKIISPKKDDLQQVIAYLKEVSFSLPLQFTNYR
ncbi:YajQ family cyclic di-GMP-binding protein [Endomicrobiia bacterium]|nr:YajQ family cyclic di-GMP-binding protein [Endomicrobiia bacterium]GHT69519.1 YajQ family cyclic di-GMP-binding protein [Endomicrobiia bacterium]GHT74262.1 YajQ family cyclic di-GMP-binding protein [Endomicrobiia bacterium]GHT74265.1 YajQ family cyclic di-GMP-binding protein [Endomicrobiia bacterium]